MAVGDIHIAGPNGWALCGASGPLRGYNATSSVCRDCEEREWAMRQSGTDAPIEFQPRTFRVINGDNGYGLSRDRDIVSEVFFAQGWNRIDHGPAWVNVHLERVNPHALPYARRNVVVPNPEWWCPVGNIGLNDLDNALRDSSVRVWAKTRDAERIFRGFGAHSVERTGFKSFDRCAPAVARERTFLHVAGVGPNKKTDRLVSMWRPEWPPLTVTCGNALGRYQSNIQIISERLSDEELRTLQNRHLFHIYPSRYEGFGHAQWEGLSCGAIVFVTDGPPFDEHHGAFRLLASTPSGHPDWNHQVTWRDVYDHALADAVAWAQALPDSAIESCRRDARSAWTRAAANFTAQARAAITALGAE